MPLRRDRQRRARGGLSSPALTAWARASGSLPAELSTFVGRKHELDQVRRLLARGRLVSLTGTGGVGKSRLALRAAATLQLQFADGVWLTELSEVEEIDLLVDAVARALRLKGASARLGSARLAEQLINRQLLLVLDNCERVLVGCAQLVQTLLRRCPALRVLVTSRQPLGVEGELVLRVPPMTVPEGWSGDEPGRLRRWEAVELLVERVQASDRAFRLDETNAAAVVELCRRLDGIPLALELAATLVGRLSLAEVLERLDRVLELLVGGATLPRRQRTLRATIEWSEQLLSEPEKAVWRRLSVFAPSFELDAAEVVCGSGVATGDRVAPLLASLCDKSMVQREIRGGRVRHRLLDMLRAYGRERLQEAGEVDLVHARFLEFVRQLVSAADAAFWGPGQAVWLDRLAAELANLRTALTLCLEKRRAETGLEIGAGLYVFWHVRGLFAEGSRWLSRLLALPHGAPETRARALCVCAYLTSIQGHHEDAARMLGEARELAAKVGDREIASSISRIAGVALIMRGDYERAAGLLLRALEGHEQAGDQRSVALTLHGLGILRLRLGDPAAAEEFLSRALRLSATAGEQWVRSWVLLQVGVLHLETGDWQSARTELTAALQTSNQLDAPYDMARELEALGWAATSAGNWERASVLLGAAAGGMQAMGAVLSPVWRTGHQRASETCRRGLGDRHFRERWRVGERMGWDDAVALALGEGPSTREMQIGLVLSRREMEVARLVAEGKTNRAIATDLFLSTRTIDSHVQHIMAKLKMGRRTQIASWLADQRFERQIP
jgi:predicted ATPase/DNA-binding CsgD family transcriptional regulator